MRHFLARLLDIIAAVIIFIAAIPALLVILMVGGVDRIIEAVKIAKIKRFMKRYSIHFNEEV